MTLQSITKKRLLGFCALLITILIAVVFSCNAYIQSYRKFIVDKQSSSDSDIQVGIVFGAGVSAEGKPYKELQARLDAAADALEKGIIDKLLLSGDNRFVNYNEPEVMKQYLITEKSIDEQKLQADFAGRSTYETCERANKVFKLKKAYLFSAQSHLPRAIFICRSFGIESYGLPSTIEADNAFRRELLANVKAIFNVYIYGENTILGDPIPID